MIRVSGVESTLRDMLTDGEDKRKKLLEERDNLEKERNQLSAELGDIRPVNRPL